jgi:hypothetical protein
MPRGTPLRHPTTPIPGVAYHLDLILSCLHQEEIVGMGQECVNSPEKENESVIRFIIK